MNRRDLLQRTALLATGAGFLPAIGEATTHTQVFDGPDSLVLGPEWESLNPGYWQMKDGALRRRLRNVGDRARSTGFPFHGGRKGEPFSTQWDPSLPMGVVYRRDQRLKGDYILVVKFIYRADRPEPGRGDDPTWRMYQDGHGFFGVALGAKSIFESFQGIQHAILVGWSDDEHLRVIVPEGAVKRRSIPLEPGLAALEQREVPARRPLPGDEVKLEVRVTLDRGSLSLLTARMSWKGGQSPDLVAYLPSVETEGFYGIAGRGLIDFEVREITVDGTDVHVMDAPQPECVICYPLGDSLRLEDGKWKAKFVGLFHSAGTTMEIRVAREENPPGGWVLVPPGGKGAIVNNDWRRHTAVAEVELPTNPAETDLFFTVWKDGVNVTGDPRIGTGACGPGTGLVGDVPAKGSYVGRLPRLTAPYKLCGLSCHALSKGLQRHVDGKWEMAGANDEWKLRDQPTEGAYREFENYGFQILVWEDDVWYMELEFFPPSTDDAWKVIRHSIAGPTSRWQMMRHWNVINPGDHDYGMDDIKGPEQLAVRRRGDLGQDPAYLRRNFQIVHHLVTGAEEIDPLENPKKWRAWKMPSRDFTLLVLDARLWRTSQDTNLWTREGWGAAKDALDRTDPTRTLLGEEQFAWLENQIRFNASPLICLTGLNGLHTIWNGAKAAPEWDQRDRVTADYAGWVKAGADRVLELLGRRSGVITVYGDVHNGSILRNLQHGLIECSFGPIGRSGGREVIEGFGPKMKDHDGREVEITALYHQKYANPALEPHAENQPYYWNFLEMEFDPRPADPRIALRLRNLVDPPGEAPRGGGALDVFASATGRPITCRFPELKLLPHADVRISDHEGDPVRAVRSLADGTVPLPGLTGVAPGAFLLVTAFDGKTASSVVIDTLPLTP